MAEYAGLTAVLAVLLTSVGGLVTSIQALPATSAQATRLVAAGASRAKVAIPEARRAYRAAPYRKPALKYLYAVGWIGAASSRDACRQALVLGSPRADVLHALERSAEIRLRLRRAKIPRAVAAAAVARGFSAGCG